MTIFLNSWVAWFSVALAIALSSIYILRKMIIRSNTKTGKLFSSIVYANKYLRKRHKLLGLLLIASGLVHGIFSNQSIISLNVGTFTWVLSILLGLNWKVRKYKFNNKSWMYYHRILAVAFTISLVIHLADEVFGIFIF